MSNIVRFPDRIVNKENYKKELKKYVFGMYSHKMVYEDGTWKEQWFIALKHRYTGIVFELTPYSRYLRYLGGRRSVGYRRPETLRVKGVLICTFLNYILIEKFEEYQITNLMDITIEHGNRFLQAYADGKCSKDKRRKPKETVNRLVIEVAKFYVWLQHIYGEKAKNIYGLHMIEHKDFINRETNRRITYTLTPFEIHASDVISEDKLTDIPTSALFILIKLSKIVYPEMTFGLCLQAFAGLRIGEVCNVRQEICPIDGGGVNYQKIGGILSRFSVNLQNKYPMRSDGINVGGIKKYRIQEVYPAFNKLIEITYYDHKNRMETQKVDYGYYPMFVNSRGMAETSQNYRKKFKRLVNNHLIPELVKSNDHELKVYAEILMTQELSPHTLRHWFTVQLVLNNELPHSIAMYRGDDDLNTATLYTKNKTELIKRYEKITNELHKDLIYFGNNRYIQEFNETKI